MQQGGEEGKLTILLKHWIEHNQGHAQEFRVWAERARQWGRTDVSEDIMRAAEQMSRANEFLLSALKKREEE